MKILPCHIRDLPKKKFRKVLHRLLSDILKREDDYIDSLVISVLKYLFVVFLPFPFNLFFF